MRPSLRQRVGDWTPHLWALVVPVVLVAIAYILGLLLLGYVPGFIRRWLS